MSGEGESMILIILAFTLILLGPIWAEPWLGWRAFFAVWLDGLQKLPDQIWWVVGGIVLARLLFRERDNNIR